MIFSGAAMSEDGPRSISALAIVERRALRDDVRDAIVNAILGGEFQPGERIVETRVARQLGVSQGTVREALREIEQLGMIVSVPNRGVLVRPMTRRDVLEMYEMRALLEGHAARRAAERATDGDLAELEALAEQMVRSADGGDVREMIRRDVAFHARICALADHDLLNRLWSAVNPHIWTYVAVRGLLDMPPKQVAERHFDVLAGLRSRDPDRAEEAMRAHLLELRDRACQKLAHDVDSSDGRHGALDGTARASG
jgi:DNA-binding GntR family transcriptional regulator